MMEANLDRNSVSRLLEVAGKFSGPLSKEISGADLLAGHRPVVYALVRREKVLYVGKGDHGVGRPFSKDHDKFGRRKQVFPTDRLLLWFLEDIPTARALEEVLIRATQPEWNHTLNACADEALGIFWHGTKERPVKRTAVKPNSYAAIRKSQERLEGRVARLERLRAERKAQALDFRRDSFLRAKLNEIPTLIARGLLSEEDCAPMRDLVGSKKWSFPMSGRVLNARCIAEIKKLTGLVSQIDAACQRLWTQQVGQAMEAVTLLDLPDEASDPGRKCSEIPPFPIISGAVPSSSQGDDSPFAQAHLEVRRGTGQDV